MEKREYIEIAPPEGPPPMTSQGGEDEGAAIAPQSQYSAVGAEDSADKLGTYIGVFRPTILTIFGVIMYVRMGWIVGNAGLIGAFLILLLTFCITGAAALSFSSITTNIRLRAGGIFALVSQSLGLEAGGAIGVPLFLAQSLGAALYIYGFAEGWSFLFPEHPYAFIVIGIFLVGFSLSFISEKLVLRLQVVVMIGVIVALVSMFAGFYTVTELQSPRLWGDFPDASLYVLFAVFFPAGTGIKVGASLSGKLKDPRRSIPLGVIAAWATAFVVYAGLIVWYAMVASHEELTNNYMIAVEKAAWGPAVMIGLLSSCTSAMLSSMVAAPNVLAALGQHGVIPGGKFLAEQSKGGTYRKAVLVNGAIVGVTLLIGDLNRVAQLITMFFLITYATINLVVLIEQSLGLLSFRPTFKVPIWIPVLGAISSVCAMIITNPFFGLLALGIIVALYIYLERRQLDTPWETVRSGIFLALADFAARKAQRFAGGNERAWKPDLLVPVDRVEQLRGEYRLLLSLMRPKGSVQVLYQQHTREPHAQQRLDEVMIDFQRERLFATHSMITAESLVDVVHMGTSVLAGSFFKPNILFINVQGRSDEELNALIKLAGQAQMGVALLVMHEEARLSREQDINIWVRDQSPDWRLGLRMASLDLAILLGYQLNRNWGGTLQLLSVIREASQVKKGRTFLKRLFRDARLPGDAKIWVEHGAFHEKLKSAPHADLNIFGLGETVSQKQLIGLTKATRSSCLFVIDSGFESALA